LNGRVTRDEILQIFKESGALLDGHFILRSGLRSRQFFQCALALQDMPSVERLGAALAEKLRGYGPVTVLAPAMGGLVIGQEVARQLGLRFIFAEKIDDKLVLRRGFKIAPDEKLIIVEDVITKGGRVAETIAIALEHQADVSAVGVVVDRSNGTVDVGAPMECLLPMEVETFDPENLPEDLQAIPPVKPGS
jgi:orotate phosphoribosyltransferase